MMKGYKTLDQAHERRFGLFDGETVSTTKAVYALRVLLGTRVGRSHCRREGSLRGHLLTVDSRLLCYLTSLSACLVDRLLVAAENGVDDLVEDHVGTLVAREGEPQDENEFEEVVNRRPVGFIKEQAGEILQQDERAEHHPVRQPFGVIFYIFGFECFERCVHRI